MLVVGCPEILSTLWMPRWPRTVTCPLVLIFSPTFSIFATLGFDPSSVLRNNASLSSPSWTPISAHVRWSWIGVVWPGCQTPPTMENLSSLGIWIRFIANLSFLGAKASAGTDPGLRTSFSRSGLIRLRTSDSFGHFRTQVSTSLADWLVEYCSVCINGDFRNRVLIALVSNRLDETANGVPNGRSAILRVTFSEVVWNRKQ